LYIPIYNKVEKHIYISGISHSIYLVEKLGYTATWPSFTEHLQRLIPPAAQRRRQTRRQKRRQPRAGEGGTGMPWGDGIGQWGCQATHLVSASFPLVKHIEMSWIVTGDHSKSEKR